MNITIKKMISLALAGTLGVSLFTAISGCSFGKQEEKGEQGNQNLVINEVVASNKYSLLASDESSPDWVEIYNGGEEAVDIGGYGLTDDASEPTKFTFPDNTVIPGNGYLLVYCAGAEETDNKDGILRTGFRISSEGETIALTGPDKTAVSLVDVPALAADISYGRTAEGAYLYYAVPSPGAENTGECNDTGEFEGAEATSALIINEYMAENDTSIADEEGERSAWVEIKNTGSEAVSLRGYGLTDDEEDPKKWSFPDKEIEGGGIVLVFLDKKNKVTENGEIHASFGLGDEDTTLLLTEERGKTVDSVSVEHLNGSISIGKTEEGATCYFALSTPGEENNTAGFASVEEAENALPSVYISELKSTSEDKIDWIELYNSGSETVDLSGYGISDQKEQPYRFRFSEKSIAPGEYLVVEGRGGSGLVADFALSSAGETVYLSAPNGIIIDALNSGVQKGERSSGRVKGSSKKVIFATATKGTENTGETYEAYAKKPEFSICGGYVSSGTEVTLTAGEGEKIYYTTDGSIPTERATAYSGAITITKTGPIRAAAYADGKLKSEVATENFIVGKEHEIPVVCISIQPSDFSGEESGIYAKGAGYNQEDYDGSDYVHSLANYWKDWEKEINFEWFEADGTKGIDFDAGMKIFGQYSRELDQKSFSIFLRGKYGLSSVTYPFFRDFDITNFSSFILRTSGQDATKTKIKDAFMHQAMKDVSDIDYMEYRPCAVYINGQYWGIYNLREKENADYVVSHYGVEKDTIDIVKGNNIVQAGDSEEWLALREYVKTRLPEKGNSNRINTKDATEYLEERVDWESFYDWISAEIFFCNTDTGNIRQFKFDGGKWRWMLFDLDWGLQTNGYSTYNFLEDFFSFNGHGSNNGFFSHMQMAVYCNDKWRNEFVERYAWHLNNTFSTERLTKLIDAMAEEIRPEMQANIDRWGKPQSMEEWESQIQSLKDTAEKRLPVAKKELQSFFKLSDARMQELFPNG